MKRITIILSVLFISFYSCANKKDKNLAIGGNTTGMATDSIKPKTNFRVHKEYDENGNLISVDSTYYYFYSNKNIDPKLEEKIFNQFKENFKTHMPQMQHFMFDDFFNNRFSDSIFKNDFYDNDFFLKNFRDKNFDFFFKQMDSIKNRFYKDQIKALKKQV